MYRWTTHSTGGPNAGCALCFGAKPSDLCWITNNVKALYYVTSTKN